MIAIKWGESTHFPVRKDPVRIDPWQTGNRGETIRYRPPTEKGKVFEKLEQVGGFLVLLTAVSTTYILSSAVILECLKDFHQEDSQKNNLFLEPIILKTSKAPFQTRLFVTDLMTQIMS